MKFKENVTVDHPETLETFEFHIGEEVPDWVTDEFPRDDGSVKVPITNHAVFDVDGELEGKDIDPEAQTVTPPPAFNKPEPEDDADVQSQQQPPASDGIAYDENGVPINDNLSEADRKALNEKSIYGQQEATRE